MNEKYKVKKSGKVTCSFDIPKELVIKLDAHNEKYGISKSFVVSKALEKYLKKEKETEKTGDEEGKPQ